jgi:hypothetical protein
VLFDRLIALTFGFPARVFLHCRISPHFPMYPSPCFYYAFAQSSIIVALSATFTVPWPQCIPIYFIVGYIHTLYTMQFGSSYSSYLEG